MARPDFILDSSIIIDITLRLPDAEQWMRQVKGLQGAITSITIMEVLRGARNKQELTRLGRELSRFRDIHILERDSRWAVQQFRVFWLSHQIGMNDCLIAAVAARMQLPLYTLNLKDFAPLPDVNAQKPY